MQLTSELNKLKKKLNVDKPADSIQKIIEQLEKQKEQQDKELQDIQDSTSRLKHQREQRITTMNHIPIEVEVGEIKKML